MNEFLQKALSQAKLGNTEKAGAFRSLSALLRESAHFPHRQDLCGKNVSVHSRKG